MSEVIQQQSAPGLRERAWARLAKPSTWLVIASLLILMLAFWPDNKTSYMPLDTNSPEPDGTKGLVLLLDRFGTKVDKGAQPPEKGTALLLRDRLDEAQTDDLTNWVRTGGTLVVTDPVSSFALESVEPRSGHRHGEKLSPQCDLDIVDRVREIEPGAGRQYPVFEPDSGARGCFPTDTGNFMTVKSVGSGRIIVLAVPDIWTNAKLAKADNSVLATNVLAPQARGVLTLVEPRDQLAGGEGGGRRSGGSGDQGLGDLLPSRLIESFWQLLLAFVLLAAWRGRRLGKPVEEPQLVEVPASALVMAVGNLMQTAGSSAAASHVLRRNLRRQLALLLGLLPNLDVPSLADIVAERTGIPRDRLLHVLSDDYGAGAQDLLRLAQEIEDLHREVANVR